MKRCMVVILIGLAILSGQASQAADLAMDCAATDRDRPSVLAAAPNGAERTGPRSLQVSWQNGWQTFTDQPPFDEPLDGIRYAYCGYSSAVKAHLISKQEEGLFTGVLMDHETGKILDAGQTVLFSPDLHKYFITRQPDGLDGEEWAVYSRAGRLLWEGLSGIVDTSGTIFQAVLENPNWTADSQLQATLVCTATRETDKERRARVILASDNGVITWQPVVTCPK